MDIAFLILAISLLASAALVAFALLRRKGGEATTLEGKVGEIAKSQNELIGRLSQSIDSQSTSQMEFTRAVNDRLDALDQRLNLNLTSAAEKTAEVLGNLQQRLSTIDDTQKSLADISSGLSSSVFDLQRIFSDKQTRGAYGQGQMEAIIRDALPAELYEFQYPLSNNTRVDCFLRMPNNTAGIVIDSKFPREGFELLRKAATDSERKEAAAQIRVDVLRHVKDISEKYIIVGETQEPAIMFVPSESIYADLYDKFSNLIEQAHRARVTVVSPNILLHAVNTMKTIIRDARMQDQTKMIQREVGLLLKDTNAMIDAVRKFRDQLSKAEGNMRDVVDYRDRIANRVSAIERVDVGPSANAQHSVEALPLLEGRKTANQNGLLA